MQTSDIRAFVGVVTWQVTEVRGGSVLFEDGAAGGTFVGVFFMDDPDPVKVSLPSTSSCIGRASLLTPVS
jgi:hypothetical protein